MISKFGVGDVGYQSNLFLVLTCLKVTNADAACRTCPPDTPWNEYFAREHPGPNERDDPSIPVGQSGGSAIHNQSQNGGLPHVAPQTMPGKAHVMR